MALSERQRLFGGLQAVSAADPKTWLFPAVDWETIGALAIDFMFFLSSITGAPTTAKLTAKFQKGHSASTGEDWIIPAWQDFTDNDVAHRCANSVGWGYQDTTGAGPSYPRSTDKTPGVVHDSTVAGGSLTVGYFITHRLVDPYEKQRVVLTPTFTGGTNPTYLVAAYAHIVRGGN